MPSLSPRPRTQPQAPGDGVIVLPDGGIILPSILSPRSRGKRRQSRLSPLGSVGGTSPQLARASTSPAAEQPPVAESLLELGRVLSLQRQGLSTLLQLHHRQSLSPDKHTAHVENRGGVDSFGQLAPRRLQSARARACLRLPQASASLGQSAAWAALAPGPYPAWFGHRHAPEPTQALTAVLDELVATEANYVADLRCATSAFCQPLADLLPSRQHHAIFGSLPQLLRIHEELEKALGAAAAAGGCHALGRGVALCGAFLAVSALNPNPNLNQNQNPNPKPALSPNPNCNPNPSSSYVTYLSPPGDAALRAVLRAVLEQLHRRGRRATARATGGRTAACSLP